MFGHSSSRKRKRSQRALAREEIIDELRLREKDFNQKYDYVYEDDGAPRRSRGGEEFIWPAGWTKLALVQGVVKGVPRFGGAGIYLSI